MGLKGRRSPVVNCGRLHGAMALGGLQRARSRHFVRRVLAAARQAVGIAPSRGDGFSLRTVVLPR